MTDSQDLDDLSRLNNELVNLQRTLAKRNAENERLIGELRKALQEVKTLRGLIPICAGCKKIRDDRGYWNQLEHYISAHSEIRFSHALCPDCMRRLYPEHSQDVDSPDQGSREP